MISTTFNKPDNSSDANFRAWGKGISDQLAAFGWVLVYQSTSWGTVTAPALANTVQLTEIWRMADALHTAGSPVYLKLEYGSSAAAVRPAVWVTVGFAVNGGPTDLSGVTSTRKQMAATTSSTTDFTSYYSGDTNRFGMVLWQSWQNGAANAHGFALVIERTHNGDGSDSADGALKAFHFAGTWGQQYVDRGSGGLTEEATWGVFAPSLGTGTIGSIIAVFPVFLATGVLVNPLRGAMAAFRVNVGELVPFTAPMFAATAQQTFLPVARANTGWCAMQRGTVANDVGLLLRWE